MELWEILVPGYSEVVLWRKKSANAESVASDIPDGFSMVYPMSSSAMERIAPRLRRVVGYADGAEYYWHPVVGYADEAEYYWLPVFGTLYYPAEESVEDWLLRVEKYCARHVDCS